MANAAKHVTGLALELRTGRRRTDELFALLRPDSLYERPLPERHRIVFYLGHMEAFDWNLIARRTLNIPSFHPSFDHLFAFGIDPPAGQLPSEAASEWPRVDEIERYNRRTRDVLDECLEDVPEEMLHAALEHRLMHAETLTYILHQLPYERKLAPARQDVARPRPPAKLREHWIEIPPGAARLGAQPGQEFGWDNEYRPVSVNVPAFAISQYKVTNGEYLEFVRAGGSPSFFWVERDGQWFYRGMFEETPLPQDWPVYVTKCQAEEYARWRGAALPTEAQFHRAGEGLQCSRNSDFRYWDPIPVTADGTHENVPAQMAGNGWEWTASVFAPFPGFEPQPYYTNYSAPFFDGAHYVLKGGSPRTAARLMRPSFRNWFRPSYPYIYATFRLVRS
ncbi:MAG: SUMF1/EgtB/PvdO family nonheme iron enzyme [Acidobacteriia bacterium]|nr:SUMF1/EgtB/PvdO family nonheme iron enzyme [Terriglobia bacterium]